MMPLEIYPEGGYKPGLIIPALIWLGVIVASIVIALMLTGCAQTFQGTCALEVLGKTDSGFTVVRTYCEAKE